MKILRDWMKHSTIYKSGLAKNVIKTQALDCLNCSFIFFSRESFNFFKWLLSNFLQCSNPVIDSMRKETNMWHFHSYFIRSYQVILSCFCFHSFLDFYVNLTPEKITVDKTKLYTKRKLRNQSSGKGGSTSCHFHLRIIHDLRTSHASVLLQALHFQPVREWINIVKK